MTSAVSDTDTQEANQQQETDNTQAPPRTQQRPPWETAGWGGLPRSSRATHPTPQEDGHTAFPSAGHGPGWGLRFEGEQRQRAERHMGPGDTPPPSTDDEYSSDSSSSEEDHPWNEHTPNTGTQAGGHYGEKAANKAKEDWKDLLNRPDHQPDEPTAAGDEFRWPPELPTTANNQYQVYPLTNDCWEIAVQYNPDFVPPFGGTSPPTAPYSLHVIVAGDRGPLDRAPGFSAGTRLRLCPIDGTKLWYVFVIETPPVDMTEPSCFLLTTGDKLAIQPGRAGRWEIELSQESTTPPDDVAEANAPTTEQQPASVVADTPPAAMPPSTPATLPATNNTTVPLPGVGGEDVAGAAPEPLPGTSSPEPKPQWQKLECHLIAIRRLAEHLPAGGTTIVHVMDSALADLLMDSEAERHLEQNLGALLGQSHGSGGNRPRRRRWTTQEAIMHLSDVARAQLSSRGRPEQVLSLLPCVDAIIAWLQRITGDTLADRNMPELMAMLREALQAITTGEATLEHWRTVLGVGDSLRSLFEMTHGWERPLDDYVTTEPSQGDNSHSELQPGDYAMILENLAASLLHWSAGEQIEMQANLLNLLHTVSAVVAQGDIQMSSGEQQPGEQGGRRSAVAASSSEPNKDWWLHERHHGLGDVARSPYSAEPSLAASRAGDDTQMHTDTEENPSQEEGNDSDASHRRRRALGEHSKDYF
ncbi:ANK3 [Symbiodinium sp. CCMP2456]|nr:ANK3 [Symbiodinium sp. CCMP2456]